MPIYTWKCPDCDMIQDTFASIKNRNEPIRCSQCGSFQCHRIISIGKGFCTNEDAPWIRSILEVVDKDSKAPHVLRFRKDPTRANYRRWMKGEGLRHAEDGERQPKKEDNTHQITDNIMKRRMKRRAISI